MSKVQGTAFAPLQSARITRHSPTLPFTWATVSVEWEDVPQRHPTSNGGCDYPFLRVQLELLLIVLALALASLGDSWTTLESR